MNIEDEQLSEILNVRNFELYSINCNQLENEVLIFCTAMYHRGHPSNLSYGIAGILQSFVGQYVEFHSYLKPRGDELYWRTRSGCGPQREWSVAEQIKISVQYEGGRLQISKKTSRKSWLPSVSEG